MTHILKTCISHFGQCSSVACFIINVRKKTKQENPNQLREIASVVKSSFLKSNAKTVAQRLFLHHMVCIPGPRQYDEHEVHMI